MDELIIVFALITSVLSSCVSLLYGYIAYKKSKEPPKDEIWETETKILCSRESSDMDKNADEFALIYESLRLFKENGYSKDGIISLEYEIRDKNISKEEAI